MCIYSSLSLIELIPVLLCSTTSNSNQACAQHVALSGELWLDTIGVVEEACSETFLQHCEGNPHG